MEWVKINGGKFADKSPDDLIEFALDATKRQLNELLDLKKEYILSIGGTTAHMKNADYSIRSFFNHNRAPLPLDVTLNVKPTRPKVEGDLTPEEIKKVILSSNTTYQAVYLSILMGGFGQDEFLRWSETGLTELLEQLTGNNLVKINISGRKGMKFDYNYYTYLGGDALAALKRYLKIREKIVKRTETKSQAIFLNQYGEPMNYSSIYNYWLRKIKRLGIIRPDEHKRKVPRYGKNPHEIRDVFRTLWRKSGVPVDYAEFFMGHADAFDKHGYDKIYKDEAETRRMYRRALDYFNIMTSNKPFGLVDINEYEDERLKGQDDRIAHLEDFVGKLVQKVLSGNRDIGGDTIGALSYYDYPDAASLKIVESEKINLDKLRDNFRKREPDKSQ